MTDQRLNKIIKVALLSSIACILMVFIEFPLGIFPGFLKMDFSDLPALIGAFSMGPIAGIAIELLKNVLYIMFKGTGSAYVGEFSNFLVGILFVVPAGILYSKNKSKKQAMIALSAGVVTMTVGASILNYFVFLPMYEIFLHFPMKAIIGMGTAVNPLIKDLNSLVILGIAPFNIFKGIIISVITLLIYKRVSPILHK